MYFDEKYKLAKYKTVDLNIVIIDIETIYLSFMPKVVYM